MKEMKCRRCGANENRIHGFCSMECETAWEYEDEIRDLTARIAELKELTEGRDPFEDFPPKERGFDCSVLVLGRFEWEEEYQPMSNWDLCRYLFNEQKWFAINGYLCEDDIVAWYPLPEGA